MSKHAGTGLLRQAADAALKMGGSASSGLRLRRRGIRSKDKGVVFAQPPAGVQWPDLITFNGTEFRETSEGGAVYRSEDGRVLDFSAK